MKVNSNENRPSYLSKRVMMVHRQNKTENLKLGEKLDRLEKAKVHNLTNITDNIRSLRHTSRQIKDVIKEMDVSEMRRRLCADRGCRLKENKINIAELLARIDSIIYNPIEETIPSVCKTVCQPNDDLLTDETNQLINNNNNNTQSREGIDIGILENEEAEKRKPFHYRKVMPPLKGRKMEEVYKEMRLEGKRIMDVKGLPDFRRASKDLEITEIKQNTLDNHERDNSKCENQNEIKELKTALKPHLNNDSKGQVHCNDIKIETKNRATVKHDRNHCGVTMPDRGKVEKITQKESYAKAIRPLSCPPNSHYADSSKAMGLMRKLTTLDKSVRNEKEVRRRCWDEHTGTLIRSDNTNEAKQIKFIEKPRPKSCHNALVDERMRLCNSAPSQRKTSRSQTIESYERTRNPNYGKRNDVDKELVYDARPRDAMTSGYATLQVAVGRKSTHVYIPKFKRVFRENEEITEKHRASKYEMEKRRIQRVKKQLDHEEYIV